MPGGSGGVTGFAALRSIRPGRCVLTAIRYINEDIAVRFLQVFDASTLGGVTLGTTIPKYVLSAGANGESSAIIGEGIVFESGVFAACTTTALGSTLAGATTGHMLTVVN